LGGQRGLFAGGHTHRPPPPPPPPQQVEACDVCEGFVLLQSMAGGTGAGAGTYLAEALVDEYASAHMLNCCVW
jgi:hypothetical protein